MHIVHIQQLPFGGLNKQWESNDKETLSSVMYNLKYIFLINFAITL